jgi:hypothetical protein
MDLNRHSTLNNVNLYGSNIINALENTVRKKKIYNLFIDKDKIIWNKLMI